MKRMPLVFGAAFLVLAGAAAILWNSSDTTTEQERNNVTAENTVPENTAAEKAADPADEETDEYREFFEERKKMIQEELTALEELLQVYEDSELWRMDFEETSRSLSNWISSVQQREEVPPAYDIVHAAFQRAGETLQEGVDLLSEAVAFADESEINEAAYLLREGREELDTAEKEYAKIS